MIAPTENSPKYDQNTLEQIARCRNTVLKNMAELQNKGLAFELPRPNPAFLTACDRLQQNTYTVIVVGEAKRGKSSFINALIGEDILPTEVDVSTARAFQVRHAEQQSFRLRFEDGSSREISKAELYTYGSQKAMDEDGSSERGLGDRSLSLIEVETPAKFLPEGVCLMDTPGVGALYAAHAEITQRFIPLADAVIFVLDSEQPVLQAELKLLEQILSITPNIFFIQTKIDRYDTQIWQELKQRNEAILSKVVSEWREKHIPDERARQNFRVDTRVWPISTRNVIKAGASETYAVPLLEKSRYPEMARALQAFLFRVAGWSRTAAGLIEAQNYFEAGSNVLMTRLSGLANSDTQAGKIVDHLKQKEIELRTQLSSQGQKRKQFKEDLFVLTDAIRRNMAQMLQSRNRAWVDLQNQINSATTNAEFEALKESIPAEVARIANDEWRTLCITMEQKIAEYRASLRQDLDSLIDYQEILGSDLPRNDDNLKIGAWDVFKGGYRDYMVAYGLAGVICTIIGGPVVPIIALAGIIWATIRGMKTSQKEIIMRTQAKLLKYMDDCITVVRGQFLDVDVKSGQHKCQIDEYLMNRQEQVLAEVDAEILHKQAEMETEIRRFEEQQKMDQTQHEKAVKEARERMTGWTGLGKQLNVTLDLVKELEAAFDLMAES